MNPIILNIAAWWPTDEKPGNGLFIYEHIKSTSQAIPVVGFLRVEQVRISKPRVVIERKRGEMDEFHVLVRTPIRRFGILESMITKGFQKLLAEVSKEYGGIDLIHFHVRDHVSKYGIHMVDALGISHMLTEHFSFYHRGIHELSKSEKNKESELIQTWFRSKNLKRIITVSQELKSILCKDFGAEDDKVAVIPNIASEAFQFAEKEQDENVRIALVAGWRHPKNPILFFEAVGKLSDSVKSELQIDFIGHGDQVEGVKSFVKENLSDLRIDIHGYMPKDQVAEFLKKTDFLAHPTDQENLPTIIAESLVCGTPVLSMNVNGIPEMIDSSNGILVEPKDADALREGIERMIEKRREFNHKNISERAQEKYSSKSIGSQIDTIINAVLNE